MKGDNHTVKNNLALDCNEVGAGLKLPHIRKDVGPITNTNSIVENNACMYANGDLHKCPKDELNIIMAVFCSTSFNSLPSL